MELALAYAVEHFFETVEFIQTPLIIVFTTFYSADICRKGHPKLKAL